MKNFMLILILLVFESVATFEISSKIDLESNEECSSSSSDNSDPIVVVIKTENTEINEETGVFRSSGGSRSFIRGNVNFRGHSRPTRPQNNYHLSPSQSKVIKNVYIVVNDKGIVSSIPGSVNCKEDICETKVTTKIDDEGNAIGSVSVSVLTKKRKKKKNFKVDDVPVIEGFRASGYGNNDDRATPTFTRNNERVLPYPNFNDDNVPQAGQTPRRNLPRPPSAPFYPSNFAPGRASTGWNPWISGRSPIDDKIERPLSKTDRVE